MIRLSPVHAREILRQKAGNIVSSFPNADGTVNVLIQFVNGGNGGFTTLNVVWRRAFQNENLLDKEV